MKDEYNVQWVAEEGGMAERRAYLKKGTRYERSLFRDFLFGVQMSLVRRMEETIRSKSGKIGHKS